MLRGFFGATALTSSWYDNNDLATATTPVSHTGGAATTVLPNDGAGSFSTNFDPANVGDIWDTVNDDFDFSGLTIGSFILMRVDLMVTTSSPGQEIDIVLDAAIGSAGPYTLNMHHASYKNAGARGVVFTFMLYVGDTNTKDNPAEIRFVSADNATIKVNGWFIPVFSV